MLALPPIFRNRCGSNRRQAVLALAAMCAALPAAHALDGGQLVPDIEFPGAAAAQRLSDLRGKLVYLDFWASWCGPCRQSFPWMNEMQRKYGPRGLQIVGINLDAKRADADQFLAQTPAAFALAFDTKADSARRLGVKGMPTSVLVAPDGRLLWVHQGFRAEERAELEAKFVAALPAKAP